MTTKFFLLMLVAVVGIVAAITIFPDEWSGGFGLPLQGRCEFADPIGLETVGDGRYRFEAARDEVLIYMGRYTTKQLRTLQGEIGKLGGRIVGSCAETFTIQVRVPSNVSEQEFIQYVESLPGVENAGFNRPLSFDV